MVISEILKTEEGKQYNVVLTFHNPRVGRVSFSLTIRNHINQEQSLITQLQMHVAKQQVEYLVGKKSTFGWSRCSLDSSPGASARTTTKLPTCTLM
jgi:hypothetical protein